MKSLSLILLFMSLGNVQAAQHTFDIKCEGPNLHYVNQFEMDEKLTLEDGLVEDVNLTLTVRKAGYESEMEVLELKNLSATVEHIYKPEIFGKAFYRLQFKSKKDAEEKVFGAITLGYPGLMTSFFRFGNLRQYKSTCKQAE